MAAMKCSQESDHSHRHYGGKQVPRRSVAQLLLAGPTPARAFDPPVAELTGTLRQRLTTMSCDASNGTHSRP
jgi:hypothetical protein